MKKDLISLLQSEEFLAKLNDASVPEEVCEIFSKEGYEISSEKARVIMDALKVANKRIRNNEEVSDKELQEIAGGRKNVVIIRRLEEIIISSDISEESSVGVPVTLPAMPPHRPVIDCENKKSQDEVVKWINK